MFSSALSGFGGFGGLSSGIIQGDQELAGGGFLASLPVEAKPVSSKPRPKPPASDLFESILNSAKPTQPSAALKPSGGDSDSVFDAIAGRVGVFMPVSGGDSNGTSTGGAMLPPSIRDDSTSANPNKKHMVHGALAGGATVLVMSTIVGKPLSTSLIGGVVVGSATYWMMRE